MSEPKYRVRLVVETERLGSWLHIKDGVLYDPAPKLKKALQAFDDILKTLDAKETADGLRESDH